MRDLPLPVKIILNVILFIIYWFVLNFLAGFLVGVFSLTGLYDVDNLDDAFFSKLSLLMLFFTFITIYFKKNFYVMKLENSNEIKKDELENKDNL